MQNIKTEIERTQGSLKKLKEQRKASFESVKKEKVGNYYNSFKDVCKQVLCLYEGSIYYPYSDKHNLYQGKEWKKENYYDFWNIYNTDGLGEPIGFISLQSGLFEATKSYHKQMWIKRITDCFKKEVRGYEDFCTNLKEDTDFLIECFENCIKETGTGTYSTEGYLEKFEEKGLGIKKHYIYYKETSRGL